jgi:ABC-type sugar transport system ATPase subunit
MPVAARHRGRDVTLGIRPQHIYRASERATPGRAGADAVVELVQVTGTRVIVTLALGTTNLIADLETTEPLSPGQRIAIEIDTSHVLLFDRRSGRRVPDIA